MASSIFQTESTNGLADGFFHFEGRGTRAPVLVQIKATTNARDLRDAMLGLVYQLEEPNHQGDMALCLLVKSRLTSSRLMEELDRFRRILEPGLKDRIFLAAMNDHGGIHGRLPDGDVRSGEYGLLPFLHEAVRSTLSQGGKKVSRQAVKSALINRWVRGEGRQTMPGLQHDTGASRPTIQAALSDLMAMGVLDHLPSPHGVSLYQMPWPAWRALAGEHAGLRRSYRYVDATGLARSPVRMAERLAHPRNEDRRGLVALGGVLGARHYFADLNLSAPTRLDLSIYDGDLGFVRELDGGLVLSDDPQARPVLVVHRTIDREASATIAPEGAVASPMDCMADLIESGLLEQAEEFSWRLNKLAEENFVKRLNL
ncbi:hypothetical protein SNE35_26260 [Paucibacter sp. R3-3]|uniref:Transcriptional regulator n=1 Tax=Roseateles agri TaxID=3098619 RepID=A0ABU5DNZ2_9BURK|nr:hypothetical protein [Paucibacter sp. R3-3]MDY0748031.1 hypothetical protein [Paucibacter sp. R3-3]